MTDINTIERNSERAIIRANDAAQLKDNPVLRDALMFRKADLFEQFVNSTEDDEEKREQIWRQMNECQSFEQYLDDVISSGMIARDDIEFYKQQQ